MFTAEACDDLQFKRSQRMLVAAAEAGGLAVEEQADEVALFLRRRGVADDKSNALMGFIPYDQIFAEIGRLRLASPYERFLPRFDEGHRRAYPIFAIETMALDGGESDDLRTLGTAVGVEGSMPVASSHRRK